MSEHIGDATYCPEDNKLRLYAYSRLPKDVYSRIKSAGFRWAPKAEQLAQVAPRFRELAGDHSRPRVVSAYQLFQTPESIAVEMVDHIPDGSAAILEPSAGLGRLYRAIRARFPSRPVTLVDVAPQCVDELRREAEADGESEVFCRDFLELTPDQLGLYSAIVMNPPFHNRSDVKHIRHAIEFLQPGGFLVSVCMGGSIRERELGAIGRIESLPPKSFHADGTDVDTSLFFFTK